MKKNTSALALVFMAICSFAQPKVYFDFVTHNEETSQWNAGTFYTNNRLKLMSLANYFAANGVTWNMQSDWVYLSNVLSKETPALTATTNNKNILLWMQDDKGVEMDPHAHESQYLYPDVVKLMDSIGLAESKVIGGTIYNDSNGINIWTNLVNGQNGAIFPDKFWRPDYMMGGGTPNHVADLKYYGIWNPQSPAAYLTHDTSSRLRHIGVGCEMKIRDTSNVADIVAELKDAVQKVQSGEYPSNGFYLQSIFFEQADLNSQLFYNKVIEIADSINTMVAAGTAQWKTLKQAYTEWETAYQAQMFQWECGQVVSELSEISESAVSIYPNPASDKLNIRYDAREKKTELSIYDVRGVLMYHDVISTENTVIDLQQLPRGLYFCRLANEDGVIGGAKVVVQ